MTRSDADNVIGDRVAAAGLLERLVAMMDRGELAAPAWYRERLVGAIACLGSPGAADGRM